MTKTRVQTRIDDSMLEKVTVVGKMLGIDNEADIVRYALTELVKNNLELIKKFGEMYVPKETPDNKWSKLETGKFVKWSFNKKLQVETILFEVFTDNTVNIQKAILPTDLEELRNKLNNSGYDINVNEEGLVVWEGEALSSYHSEDEILKAFTQEFGEEIFYPNRIMREHQIQELANDYGIHERLF